MCFVGLLGGKSDAKVSRVNLRASPVSDSLVSMKNMKDRKIFKSEVKLNTRDPLGDGAENVVAYITPTVRSQDVQDLLSSLIVICVE